MLAWAHVDVDSATRCERGSCICSDSVISIETASELGVSVTAT